ncbi:ABC transporter permease [Micromonospora parathelypteridis]|uniref:NitT/TauT family transport system permease protein n=1 Tax=Micromonospora parathelypteridis TaxID=1839617 RepID=A0A840WD32_9ACTN|nr:ABC transporter permease [Micromonospora parathelypteridis]MBB5480911.1 NitT/TauT family transport system permease protein [Micromonospora parathelypteridis]GGO21018.1 ABC transporter permease [Micromonospora parathelypteridis]
MTDSPTPSQRWPHVGLPTLGAVLAIALWWLATWAFDIEPFFLPAPPDVVDAFVRLPGYLAEQTLITFLETVIGFGIATVGGLLLAVLLAASRTVERMALPMIAGINAVPKVALAPLLLVWIGFGYETKVVMVVLLCFFPILVSTMAGLTSTPNELAELARSLSASWWQTFVKVRLPWALPQVFVGLKVATSLAIIGATIGEVINPEAGLGSVIASSGQSADTPLAFAALTLLALMGALLFYLMAGLERLLAPWARAISS